jgi:hypothetical protein
MIYKEVEVRRKKPVYHFLLENTWYQLSKKPKLNNVIRHLFKGLNHAFKASYVLNEKGKT